jgi:hypothetical protein
VKSFKAKEKALVLSSMVKEADMKVNGKMIRGMDSERFIT